MLQPSSARRPAFLAVAVSAALLCAGGCVQRTISVTSTPSGALVHLNDEEVGRTPLVVPFKFYGVYDVRLEKEGYAPLWTTAQAKAPWWEAPGPDLVAEAIPGMASAITWHFDLQPQEVVDEEALISRAQDLRQLTRDADETE